MAKKRLTVLLGLIAAVHTFSLVARCAPAQPAQTSSVWTTDPNFASKLNADYSFGPFSLKIPAGWSQSVTNSADYDSPRLLLVGPKQEDVPAPRMALVRHRLQESDDKPSAVDSALAGALIDVQPLLRNMTTTHTEEGVINGHPFERLRFAGDGASQGKALHIVGFVYATRIPLVGGSIVLTATGFDSQPAAEESIPFMEASVMTIRRSDDESKVREPFADNERSVAPASGEAAVGPFGVHLPDGFRPLSGPGESPGTWHNGENIFRGPIRADGTFLQVIVIVGPLTPPTPDLNRAEIDALLAKNIGIAQTGPKKMAVSYKGTEPEAGLVNEMPFDRIYFAYTDSSKNSLHGFAYCGYAKGWCIIIKAIDTDNYGSSSLPVAESIALTLSPAKSGAEPTRLSLDPFRAADGAGVGY